MIQGLFASQLQVDNIRILFNFLILSSSNPKNHNPDSCHFLSALRFIRFYDSRLFATQLQVDNIRILFNFLTLSSSNPKNHNPDSCHFLSALRFIRFYD